MKKSPHKRTSSLSEFHDKAQALLEEYIARKYVSAAEEREYLKAFAHVRKVLKNTFGRRVNCALMLTSDVMIFRGMPQRLRLYRGYYEPEKRNGISWSLSRKVAEGFAYSNWNIKDAPPHVVTGTCLLSRVLAYTNDRSEQEFIVDPKDVRSIRNIKVRAKPSFPVTAEPLEELLKGMQHHGSEIISTPVVSPNRQS